MRIKTNDKDTSIVQKNRYENVKNEITLTAILNCVYAQKISNETIQTKVNHQIQSIETAINRINPKFGEKSKNYDKIKEQIMDILSQFEANLKQFCVVSDNKIQETILQKVELESQLFMAVLSKELLEPNEKKQPKQKDKNKPKQNVKNTVGTLEREVRKITQKINELNEQKVKKIFDAMETENKAISTQIRKPRTIKKITKFFANRFNTYNVIMKTVLEPIEHRIDEFKINELEKVDFQNQEFDLKEMEEKIKKKEKNVFENEENKKICESLGIF